MKEVYLDNAATTPVDARVKKAMEPYFSEKYGNPGSMNSKGLEAKEAVDKARMAVAKILNCESAEPEEIEKEEIEKQIIFTGSGTESINLAVKGHALWARKNSEKQKEGKTKNQPKNHIITSKTEHHAVLHTCQYLEKEEGFRVTYLDVDKEGIVNPDNVEKAITGSTALITIMYANNEVGAVNDIKKIAAVAKKHNVVFHTDACQAGEYLNIDVRDLGVDMMTLNSSKVYGPKGMGLLYKRKEIELFPLIHGGGQESSIRSGTHNVPGIVGFAKALEIAQQEKEKEAKRLTILRDKLIKEILTKIPKTRLNGHPTKRLPNNVNISFLNVEGESLLLLLNEEGIYAATGSACTSKSLDPSHVLTAMGIPEEAAHGSIRFTLGRHTTEKDADFVIKRLIPTVEKLRSMSPVHLEKISIKG